MPMSNTKRSRLKTPVPCRPFPWKCLHCRQEAVVPARVSYSTEVEHDGRTYAVNVPDLEMPRCEKCGELVRDDAANRRITAELRCNIGLLSPEQIRDNRETLGLTQKQLAKRLGIADATLSRWETGLQIQQRALDKLLRLYFAFPEARSALADEKSAARLGAVLSPHPRAARRGEASRRPAARKLAAGRTSRK